jgi:hypothetical protein
MLDERPMLRAWFLILLLSGFPFWSKAQRMDRTTAFGLQYRPILAAPLLDTGPVRSGNEEFDATLVPELGHDFGVVLRWGIGERLAIETGIDQIRRNFSIRVKDQKSSYQDRIDFNMLAYQLPLRALLYVRIGRDLYANVAAGAVADIFPTDWTGGDGNSSQFTQRFNWLLGGFTANLGMEYRTKKSGAFYLGGTYHRPITNPPKYGPNIAAMEVSYKRDQQRLFRQTLVVPGNYITLDLKYFFPGGDG